MRILRNISLIAMAALLAGAGAASAADHCYVNNFGTMLVAKSLRLPTANKCKPVNGYFNGTLAAVSGRVCTTRGNAAYVFNLTFSNSDTNDDTGFFVFYVDADSQPNGVGHHLLLDFGSGGSATLFSISKVTCPADPRFGG